MLLALALVTIACLLLFIGGFAMTKLLFAVTGVSFALIKVSVYATIGLATFNKRNYASFMNFIESFFMIGISSGYFTFSAFVDNTNQASTSWLNVYYLLAIICMIAFILLSGAWLDESSIKNVKVKSFWKDFADMIKLAIRPLVLIFIISAFFMC